MKLAMAVLSAVGVLVLYSCTPFLPVTPADDPRLAALEIEGHPLVPLFDPDETNYSATVTDSTDEVTVHATAEESRVEVTGAGTIAIVDDETEILIALHDPETDLTRAYVILVTRVPEVDTSAPEIIGLASPSGWVQSVEWSWSSNEADAEFRYAVDQQPGTPEAGISDWSTTNTSATLDSVTGVYYAHVQARDTAGNTSAWASSSAYLDNSPPTAPTVTVSNVDFYRPQWYWNTSIDYDGFRYQLNSERGAWTDVARGYYQPVANLEPGTYTLYVQACDSAGNWSLSGSATIDLPVRVRISDVTIESEVLRKVIESQGLTYVDEVKSIQYRNDSGFADIRGIRHFTNLAEVDFSGSPELADISELEYLTGLERLNLGDCNVTELGAIAGLDSLRYLFLSHNTELADLEPLLLGLPNLEELYLQYTEFTDKDIEEIAAAHPDCVVVSAPD